MHQILNFSILRLSLCYLSFNFLLIFLIEYVHLILWCWKGLQLVLESNKENQIRETKMSVLPL